MHIYGSTFSFLIFTLHTPVVILLNGVASNLINQYSNNLLYEKTK